VRISYPSRGHGARRSALALRAGLVVVLGIALGACGGAAPPKPTPTPAPTPTPTPNPHLSEPVAVETIWADLFRGGLKVVGNNADAGASGEPVNRINATYAGWPLIISQYSSSAAARAATGMSVPLSRPVADQAPFTFVGLNIVAEFGPHLLRDTDPAPEARFVQAANALAAVLDPLLGPLEVRASAPLALPTPTPAASASPSATATPKPTARPTPKPTPKPTAKPKATPTPKP
jgi:hypothetical protein